MLAGLAALIALVFSIAAFIFDTINKDEDDQLTHNDYD